jgi:hypothetical protein
MADTTDTTVHRVGPEYDLSEKAHVTAARQPIFTPAELAEMAHHDALRRTGYSFPYAEPPLHTDPLVCEIAEILREFGI